MLVIAFFHWFLVLSSLSRCSIACLAALNKFSDCLHLVNRDLDRDPKNPDLYTLRARLYDHFNKVREASWLPRLCCVQGLLVEERL